MWDWFKRLSPGRKFLVGWNVIIFPFWLAGLIYFVFVAKAEPAATVAMPFWSISFPFSSAPLAFASVAAAAVIGVVVLWKLLK